MKKINKVDCKYYDVLNFKFIGDYCNNHKLDGICDYGTCQHLCPNYEPIMETTDYVSYPIALALKKAGFDWKCHYGYSVKMRLEPEPSFGEPKMVHSKVPKNYNDNRKGIGKGLEFCSAVPLWQAQKWLREKCGIHIDVCIYSDYSTDADGEVCDKWDFWGFDLYVVVGGKKLTDDDGEYDSYEQALSAGIAAALELIEKKGE